MEIKRCIATPAMAVACAVLDRVRFVPLLAILHHGSLLPFDISRVHVALRNIFHRRYLCNPMAIQAIF